ncbi:MAG: nucleoside 2-deoxyribosyltransferase [Bacteriovoracaceae bacterium]
MFQGSFPEGEKMNDQKQCFFCEEEASIDSDNLHRNFAVHCSACGYYKISGMVVKRFIDTKNSDKLGSQAKVNCAYFNLIKYEEKYDQIPFWLTSEEEVEVITEEIKINPKGFEKGTFGVSILSVALMEVDHSSKAKELLYSVSRPLKNNEPFGQFYFLPKDRVRSKISSLSEYEQIVSHLYENGYIAVNELLQNTSDTKYQMTLFGWDEIKDIQEEISSNKVFIAMQFDWKKENPLRVNIYNAMINACKDCGYDASIVSQSHTENITNKILSEIKESKFVIAEMTYNNRGVYFESGYARGLGKNVFHVIKDGHTSGNDNDGTKIHFDIQQTMYRKWNDPEELRETLRDWIDATVGNYE